VASDVADAYRPDGTVGTVDPYLSAYPEPVDPYLSAYPAPADVYANGYPQPVDPYADPYAHLYAQPVEAYQGAYAQPVEAYQGGYAPPAPWDAHSPSAYPSPYPAAYPGTENGDRVIDLTDTYIDLDAYPPPPVAAATAIDARSISAWFGTHKVLDRVSLHMPAGTVTALIGPSGCGKSTFLRILNRMHELIPSAALAGEVLLNGEDIYDATRRVTETRKRIGMVFQKPNPFPAMTIGDNVVAGLKLNGLRVSKSDREALIEECLTRGGLWNEVKDRLDTPGGSLSGGQQQRLCIARSLAVRPEVLLMDEPCSALDPTSTRRVEETIAALASEVTIVIVTHNMQQANRVSQQCAFFLAEQGTPGFIVESGATQQIFNAPRDPRTADYVNGRFG
jgi:phosphate transport system ATP-binding protein